MKLNLGSHEVKIPGYLNVDIYKRKGVDIVSDISKLDMKDESVDEIYASHCLEHFPRTKQLDVVKEWYRVLKKGGTLYLAVPDIESLVKIYNKIGIMSDMLIDMFYGLQDEPYNFHYMTFTYAMLLNLVCKAGFEDGKKVDVFPHGIRDCSWVTDMATNTRMSLNIICKK